MKGLVLACLLACLLARLDDPRPCAPRPAPRPGRHRAASHRKGYGGRVPTGRDEPYDPPSEKENLLLVEGGPVTGARRYSRSSEACERREGRRCRSGRVRSAGGVSRSCSGGPRGRARTAVIRGMSVTGRSIAGCGLRAWRMRTGSRVRGAGGRLSRGRRSISTTPTTVIRGRISAGVTRFAIRRLRIGGGPSGRLR